MLYIQSVEFHFPIYSGYSALGVLVDKLKIIFKGNLTVQVPEVFMN